MERREFVKVAGMGSVALTAGLAGCQGDGSDGNGDGDGGGSPVADGELARYNQWVYADAYESGEMFAVSMNIGALPEDEEAGETETENGDGEEPDDPLAAIPLAFFVLGAFAAGLGTYGLGLDSLSEDDSGTEKIHVASGGIVFEGDYDAASLESSVAQAGASEAEDYGGYTLYTDAGSEGNTSLAVSSDTVIIVSPDEEQEIADTLGRTKGLVDASNGDATPLSEEISPFGDLMSALPNRPIMGVAYSDEAEPLNEEDEDGTTETDDTSTSFADTNLSGRANGLATSANLTQNSLTSSLALRYESEGEVDDQSDIEDAIGTEASDRTVNIDGPLVVIEGSYDEAPDLDNQ